jgi:hypothetical protein
MFRLRWNCDYYVLNRNGRMTFKNIWFWKSSRLRQLVPFMLLILLTMQGCSHEAKTADIYVPDQSVSDLSAKLQSPQTTDQASDQMESLAEPHPRIRNYLTERIPALIDAGPQHYQPQVPDAAVQYPGPVWRNAVMLASELKVAELRLRSLNGSV